MSTFTSQTEEINQTPSRFFSRINESLTTMMADRCGCYGCEWNNQNPLRLYLKPCTAWELDTYEEFLCSQFRKTPSSQEIAPIVTPVFSQDQDVQETSQLTQDNECHCYQWNNQEPLTKPCSTCTAWEMEKYSKVVEEEELKLENISKARFVLPTIICKGCLEDEPNQLAHIGPTGCLGDDE